MPHEIRNELAFYVPSKLRGLLGKCCASGFTVCRHIGLHSTRLARRDLLLVGGWREKCPYLQIWISSCY